ncbi:capsid cement protein [Micromonospora krabiensis]|uniref:Uncharacterized protein n=1 Tax=Micromonospora krabiensis TaxID=307121 RepID=A0A1C3N4Q9_9ACTN|nr:capsid cement protein [Micromonospora krabiensis]SBV27558.1 hypothetical protein GA0070620_3082 [Micromonospora krabiensis]
MADYTPVYTNGNKPMTKTASAAITGGQIVAASGVSTVAPAGAASTAVVGVAAHDAANGARVTVWPLTNVEHEVTVVAAGTVTAGDGVVTGASGTAATAAVATAAAAGTLIGTATTTATAPNKVRFIGRG